MIPPRSRDIHGTCECVLVWKKVLADMVKDLEMKLSWIRVDLKSNDK